MALIVHRFATSGSTYDGYDSIWCFFLQIIASIAVLASSLRKVKNEQLQKTVIAIGLGITIILGLVGALFFMFAFNYQSINCAASTNYTDIGDYSMQSICARTTGNIVRTCIFWVVE
ncbi:hypothetical protein HDU99_008024, partial [Rhizoclosmatium hyalinum]